MIKADDNAYQLPKGTAGRVRDARKHHRVTHYALSFPSGYSCHSPGEASKSVLFKKKEKILLEFPGQGSAHSGPPAP